MPLLITRSSVTNVEAPIAFAATLRNLVLVRRFAALGVLFALELAVITLYLDNDQLAGRGGLIAFCHDWGPLILRAIVAAGTVFLTFACIAYSAELVAISEAMAGMAIDGRALGGHFAALASFGILSQVLYRSVSSWQEVAALGWLVSGVLAIWFGAIAFVGLRIWRRIWSSTGYLWLGALVAAMAAAFGGNALRPLWPRATALTFSMVQALLRPFGVFSVNPAKMTIGGARFAVEIAPACSGLEGIGLILAFTIVWLVLFRREIRFPQALVLLPAGVVILFLLNSVRIAALLLIGNAGFKQIAAGGFHSQAGWIAFNLVALGTSIAARNNRWISTRPTVAAATPTETENLTAPWVVPFVAILALGMISRALTGSFEWLYPLRLAGAASALWIYRDTIRSLDWQVDWLGIAGGVAVFGIWIALDRQGRTSMPLPLQTAAPGMQLGWIALRAVAATITVPLAEELAFRGFLLRRFISPEFETVSFRQFSWFAMLASSVLFGLLHGQRWIAGSIAGAIFALVMLRRGRFGNAVVAHAVANGLLALDVLVFGRWGLW